MEALLNSGVFERIVNDYNRLTRSEKKVADYILRMKHSMHYSISISELAHACGVGVATITRFCRKIGCTDFNGFKLAVAQSVGAQDPQYESDPDLYGDIRPGDSIEQKIQKLYAVGTLALKQTMDSISPEQIARAVDLIIAAPNVYCFGQGNSSIVAMGAFGRFASVTPKFHWIADAHLQTEVSALLGTKDVVLYFSFSGETRALDSVARQLKGSGAKLILVTRYPNSPGASYADVLLICGAYESPRHQGSIAAKIGQLFIIDILFNEYTSRDVKKALKNQKKTQAATELIARDKKLS